MRSNTARGIKGNNAPLINTFYIMIIKTKELADKISFRLLATNKHSDYEWLCNELKKLSITKTENSNHC